MSKSSEATKVQELASRIADVTAQFSNTIRIMEVCGSHTMAIAKLGLKQLLPNNIELLSGPGCPVCVTPQSAIDQIIQIASLPNVSLTTFGDMLRVPGSTTSLSEIKSQGADVRVVYNPSESLELALQDPTRQVVFAAVGFETTAPITALLLKQAESAGSLGSDPKSDSKSKLGSDPNLPNLQNLDNFSVFCEHKRLIPALEWLCEQPKLAIDAFLLPGHVSAILGVRPYADFATLYRIPGVIAGFAAHEILQAILDNLQILQKLQMGSDPNLILNDYESTVKYEGNITALQLLNEVFVPVSSSWRGLGTISNSSYGLAPVYSKFDAKLRFADALSQIPDTSETVSGCRCGEILTGQLHPNQCPLFGQKCTPEHPFGPCMVSNEGSCAAAYLLK